LRAGHQVTLLQGGTELFSAMVQAMDAAQHEVRLETYMFDDRGASVAVADALVRCAQRGVRCYLVVDGVGTPELTPARRQQFAAAGVRWQVFAPLGRLGLLVPSGWRRLHRKLCVVDGELAFCGGINLLDDLYDPTYGVLAAPRLDFAVRVQGPLVQDMLRAMVQLWWRRREEGELRRRRVQRAWLALQQRFRRAMQARAEAQALRRGAGGASGQPSSARAELLLRDNLLHRGRIERAYRKAIAAAQSEIIIANAYFLPGAKLRRALVLAARRGVRVRLLLQGRYEYFLQFHGVRPIYDVLLRAGVEIHEYAPSFLHAKVAVVDGRWATVGSSNLDPLSLLLAREANLTVDDAAFAQALRARLLAVIEREGRLVDPASCANRPWRQRLLDRLAFGLMRVALFLLGRRY
jgi:cardiolipin synthase